MALNLLKKQNVVKLCHKENLGPDRFTEEFKHLRKNKQTVLCKVLQKIEEKILHSSFNEANITLIPKGIQNETSRQLQFLNIKLTELYLRILFNIIKILISFVRMCQCCKRLFKFLFYSGEAAQNNIGCSHYCIYYLNFGH